jgi:hypothetical protein
LTPAYSIKIVEELIENYERPMRIFDPFCGTATTALIAAYHGHEGVTTDINPFLVWLGQAKAAHYSPREISAARQAGARALEMLQRKRTGGVISSPPPIHNIERWWSADSLEFLCTLKSALESTTDEGTPERTLLLVAFCRTLIAISNAAFDHQSMSFKDDGQIQLSLDLDLHALYAHDVDFVLEGASDNPEGSGRVILGDSRNPAECVEGSFDCVITSPPYANRMSYIRELRPYMYWLGFLSNGRDAGELDWSAIGGTWGVATSRLADWKATSVGFQDKELDCLMDQIADRDNKNGELLSKYVAKYFDDMWTHFSGLTLILNRGAEIHYIVGNSTFYGVLLPVEKLYSEMLRKQGFTNIQCRTIRKRNSKKALIEFDVSAVWPGPALLCKS